MLSRARSRLRRLYKTVFAAPKVWSMPRKSQILIYDATGAEILRPYLLDYDVETVALEGEFVNVPCLLRAFLTPGFWVGNMTQAYVDAFVRATSPQVVLTFIDNNRNFYTIACRFPHIKTLLLQNGSRSEVGDIFDSLVRSDEYHVSYMLVHGSAIGDHYRKFISGKTIPVGSFKSNQVKPSHSHASASVLFVSHYHDKPGQNAPFLIKSNGEEIPWNQFFAAEMLVLPFLGKWCCENKLPLRICGRAFDAPRQMAERNFFASLLPSLTWEYVLRTGTFSSYDHVDAAKIVVTIDSTLGYESIGRGKRTASFSCRGLGLNSNAAKFGWPATLPDNGPFWTNFADEKEFQRIMDYLNSVDDET